MQNTSKSKSEKNATRFSESVPYALSIEPDESISFPMWNLSGQLTGYQIYRPSGIPQKYKSFGTGMWGLEYLNKSDSILFLVEGVFDAIAVKACGFQAIAVLGRDPKHLKQQIKLLPYYKVVLAENDDGLSLGKYGHEMAICPNKDPDEMPREELKKWLTKIQSQVLTTLSTR
jgi:hypothetical protein